MIKGFEWMAGGPGGYEGAGEGEVFPEWDGIELGLVVRGKECEDGAVGDDGDVAGVVGGHDGVNGRYKTHLCLNGRFIPKHQFIWLGEQTADGGSKRFFGGIVRHIGTLVLM